MRIPTFIPYHMYPVPIDNFTLVPPKPILVLGTTYHLLLDEECPLLEETSICHGQLIPNAEQCLPALVQGNENLPCNFTPVALHQPLVKQVSRHHILVLTFQRIDIRSTCPDEHLQRISTPYLVTVPDGCYVNINGVIYSAKTNLLNATSLVLPEVLHLPESSSLKPLHLEDIPIEDLKGLQQQLHHLQPLQTIPNLQEYTSHILLYTLIGCLICFSIIYLLYHYRRKYLPALRTETQNPAREQNPAQSPSNQSTPDSPF